MVFNFTTDEIVHIRGMIDEFLEEFGALVVMKHFMDAGVCSGDVLELLGLEDEWWFEVNDNQIPTQYDELYNFIDETNFKIEKIWDVLDELDENEM